MFQSIVASLLASVMLLSPQISIPKLDVSDWKALCPEEPIYGITMWAGESSAPVGFRLKLREEPSYMWAVSQYPESGFVIFHGSEPNNEFLGFQILSDFASVPWERRRDMTCLGVQASGIRDNYDEVEYRADGYSVFVLQLQPGGCNLDQLDGKISAIIVDTPKYATRRGLRCGDSAERAWNLYGAEMLTSFGYEVENGVVTRYGFRSPYYTMCGIPSMFLLY